jgi:hypothetical protein
LCSWTGSAFLVSADAERVSKHSRSAIVQSVPCGSAESAGPASNAFEAGTGDVESASRESCYVERFQNVAAMVNLFAGAMVNLFTRCELSLRSTAGLASNRLAGVESISGGTQAERVSKRLRVARFSRCRMVCGVRRTGRCRVDTARVSQKSHHVEESSSGGGFARVCAINEACKCVCAINEACKCVRAVRGVQLWPENLVECGGS